MPHFLRVLLTPGCWIRNRGTSEKLSEFILKRLSKGEIPQRTSPYTATFGGKTIWVANYPYCFGYIYSTCGDLPNRRAVFALHDALEEFDYPELDNQ